MIGLLCDQSSLRDFVSEPVTSAPAMNRWAIVRSPCGTMLPRLQQLLQLAVELIFQHVAHGALEELAGLTF